NLTRLERLYLYDNQLSGPIPSEIGNLVNLTEAFLDTNQFSGPIPNSIVSIAITSPA
ncbi:Receptor-like protein 35, partial [Linum grandiflorum]